MCTVRWSIVGRQWSNVGWSIVGWSIVGWSVIGLSIISLMFLNSWMLIAAFLHVDRFQNLPLLSRSWNVLTMLLRHLHSTFTVLPSLSHLPAVLHWDILLHLLRHLVAPILGFLQGKESLSQPGYQTWWHFWSGT